MNNEDKEFWLKLGIEIAEAKSCSQETKARLDKFIDNEFHALEEKVERLTAKLAMIMGAVSVLWALIQIGIKVFIK